MNSGLPSWSGEETAPREVRGKSSKKFGGAEELNSRGCTYFRVLHFSRSRPLVRDPTLSSMSSYLLQVKSDSRSTTCEGACKGPIHKGGPAKPEPAPRATRLLFLTASSSPSPNPTRRRYHVRQPHGPLQEPPYVWYDVLEAPLVRHLSPGRSISLLRAQTLAFSHVRCR